jgi:hypothetical protein
MPRMNGGVVGAANVPTTTIASGVWRPSGVATIINGANQGEYWPSLNDPHFSSVQMLYHFDQFTYDSSVTAVRLKDWSGKGNNLWLQAAAAGVVRSGLSSDQPKWGNTQNFRQISGFIEGLNSVATSGTNFGTGDYTIEGWIRLNSGGAGNDTLLFDMRTTDPQAVISISLQNSANVLRVRFSGSYVITGSTALSNNTWYWFALSRVSGSTYLYLGTSGTANQEGSTWSDSNNYANTNALYLGTNFSATTAHWLDGWFGEMRVTKGVGRYSGSTAIVPTARFPDY